MTQVTDGSATPSSRRLRCWRKAVWSGSSPPCARISSIASRNCRVVGVIGRRGTLHPRSAGACRNRANHPSAGTRSGAEFRSGRQSCPQRRRGHSSGSRARPWALPLLSFLLDQLWQRRTNNGTLTFVAHNELGGLEGALGRRAGRPSRRNQPTFKRRCRSSCGLW